jgi:hypothetical protein
MTLGAIDWLAVVEAALATFGLLFLIALAAGFIQGVSDALRDSRKNKDD